MQGKHANGMAGSFHQLKGYMNTFRLLVTISSLLIGVASLADIGSEQDISLEKMNFEVSCGRSIFARPSGAAAENISVKKVSNTQAQMQLDLSDSGVGKNVAVGQVKSLKLTRGSSPAFVITTVVITAQLLTSEGALFNNTADVVLTTTMYSGSIEFAPNFKWSTIKLVPKSDKSVLPKLPEWTAGLRCHLSLI